MAAHRAVLVQRELASRLCPNWIGRGEATRLVSPFGATDAGGLEFPIACLPDLRCAGGQARHVSDRAVQPPGVVLLHEAAETHHQVFRITDGTDADWASWYADWLTKLSEFPSLVGGDPVRSEVVYMLVKLDKDYTASGATEAWESYYANRLIEHFVD